MFLASFILKIFLVKIFLWKYLWWKWKYFWKIFMVKEKIFLVKIFLVKIFLAKIFLPPLLTAHPLWPYINPHPFSTPHQWFLKLSVTHEGRTYGARRQENISTDELKLTIMDLDLQITWKHPVFRQLVPVVRIIPQLSQVNGKLKSF